MYVNQHLLKFVAFVSIVIASGTLSPLAKAQRPSSSKYSLAVDEVTLANGNKMYGIVMQRSASGLTMMIERAWFKTTYPQQYSTHQQAELESEIDGYTKNLFRLEAWWKSRVDDLELVQFADKEMERIEKIRGDRKAKGTTDIKPFTLVAYDAHQIKDVYIQPPANRKLAGLAWKHKLDRVTSRSITSLKRELEDRNVDVQTETFDLSSQLPTSSRIQSDSEWNARIAILEYQLRKPLDFQGVDSLLIRIDPNRGGNQAADIQALFAQFAGGGLGSGFGGGGQLNELLNELGLGDGNTKQKKAIQWWKKAAETAQSEGFNGFAVTRLIQDATKPAVRVECSFIAQTSPGVWRQILQASGTANRSDVKQASIDRIKEDPQVKKVLGLTQGLGLGSDYLIDKAIRQGAATELAMQDAQEKFHELLSKFAKQTDSPALNF